MILTDEQIFGVSILTFIVGAIIGWLYVNYLYKNEISNYKKKK